MPDWVALVRERLQLLNLPAREAEEVTSELAAHLEDFYEEQIKSGIDEAEARQQAMNEIARDHKLAKGIERSKLKEEIMNARTKQFWLPGLVNLTAAMILLAPLITLSMQPRFLGRSPVQMVLIPWLVLLPLCGAAGAWLSRRAGGDLRARLIAGLFPILAFLVPGSALVATRLVTFAQPEWLYGFVALAVTVIFPGMALLIGAAPFLNSAKEM
jgi:hypothetical protein